MEARSTQTRDSERRTMQDWLGELLCSPQIGWVSGSSHGQVYILGGSDGRSR